MRQMISISLVPSPSSRSFVCLKKVLAFPVPLSVPEKKESSGFRFLFGACAILILSYTHDQTKPKEIIWCRMVLGQSRPRCWDTPDANPGGCSSQKLLCTSPLCVLLDRERLECHELGSGMSCELGEHVGFSLEDFDKIKSGSCSCPCTLLDPAKRRPKTPSPNAEPEPKPQLYAELGS